MTEPNEKHKALMRKYKLIPKNWLVYSETSKKLIVLSKHTRRRMVLDKEKME